MFEDCKHDETVNEDDYNVCIDCGVMLSRTLITQQFCGSNNTLRRKAAPCSIYKDIPEEFDPSVRNMAINIYNAVTSQKIFRHILRRSILAACIHRASVILKAPLSTCFDAFNISAVDANRGMVFVAVNLSPGLYTIPFMADERDILSLCTIHSDLNHEHVLRLYESIKSHESSSIKRLVLVCSCVWYVLVLTVPTSKITIDQFIDSITTRIKSKRKLPVSKIENKYNDISKYVLSRTMKRIVSRCLQQIIVENNTNLVSTTPDIPVTMHNCTDPDLVQLIADDGFVYPLDDVDDVLDWNIVFDMKFQEVKIPISITKSGKLVFDEPLDSNLCNDIVNQECLRYVTSSSS